MYKFHKSHKANPSYIGGVTIVKTSTGELSATVCMRCGLNNLSSDVLKKCHPKVKPATEVKGIPITPEMLSEKV